MGTKHGYTEKKCNVCQKVKKRDEYPKRGGLTCTACQNKKRRESGESANRWKNATPEYREAQKKRMLDWKRKKKGK